MSEQQAAVVAHDRGPLLVLGAAGSGRTEALARRLARLVGEGDRPLALTRSIAAANRIRARAEETIETAYEELVVHTHPVAAARLLRSTPPRRSSTLSSSRSAPPSGSRCCGADRRAALAQA